MQEEAASSLHSFEAANAPTITGTLYISADRPVMKVQASIYKDDFIQLQLALSQPSQPRPATFVISLTELGHGKSTRYFILVTADTEIAIAEMNGVDTS